MTGRRLCVGLWLGRRWGEYFAMVATSVFLPYEIYDLTVKVTWLRVGALASVDPESLTFAFDCLKAGTPCESATLAIEWRSRFGCSCQVGSVALDDPLGVCPNCGAAESFADATALDVRYLEFDGGEAA